MTAGTPGILPELMYMELLMYESKLYVPCCSLMVKKVGICASGSRYLGIMNKFYELVDEHLFSSESQAEVYSDLQSTGGNKQLQRTILEEVGTAV